MSTPVPSSAELPITNATVDILDKSGAVVATGVRCLLEVPKTMSEHFGQYGGFILPSIAFALYRMAQIRYGYKIAFTQMDGVAGLPQIAELKVKAYYPILPVSLLVWGEGWYQ